MTLQTSPELFNTTNLDDIKWFQANRDKLVRYRTMSGAELNEFYASAYASKGGVAPSFEDSDEFVLAVFPAELQNPLSGQQCVAVGYFLIDLRMMDGAEQMRIAREQVMLGDPILLLDVLMCLSMTGDVAAQAALQRMVLPKEVSLPHFGGGTAYGVAASDMTVH